MVILASDSSMLRRALWLGAASVVVALLTNITRHNMRIIAWHEDLHWYIATIVLLPWYVYLAMGLHGKYPARRSAWWIVPLLVGSFGAGCWLVLFAESTPPPWRHSPELACEWRGILRVSLWTLPFAVVPVGVYLLTAHRFPPSKEPDRPVCSACGYNLQGSAASERCPECGNVIRLCIDAPQPVVE